MTRLIIEIIVAFNGLILLYFLVLNGFYALLLLVSSFGVRNYNRDFDLSRGTTLPQVLQKPFTLLIPAYNEELMVVDSVRSFLHLDYPEFEVIVANDGSTDGTLDRLKEAFALEKVEYDITARYPCKPIRAVYFSRKEPRLVVVDKDNGGKADAQNAAANVARYSYVGAVDADSVLSRDSMRKLMQWFSASPLTVGVGGIVRVSNGCKIHFGQVKEVGMPRSFLERVQVVEYLRAFLFGRIGWSHMNILLIISGAFGVFRQDILQRVGGWNQKALAEDMELVTRLHRYIRRNKLPNTLSFTADPVCWTQVPSDLAGLSTQRDRWQRGLMQTLLWNIGMFLNPRYGRIGLIGFPYFLIFEMLGCVIELFAIPLVAASFFLGIVNLPFFIGFLVVALLCGLVVTYAAIFLEELSYSRYHTWKDLARLFVAGFLENFGYRQIHTWWRFRGFIKYIFRIQSGWGTIKRAKMHA